MHFYQNKHGRLLALLVLLLTQVHIAFQKNQLFKVVCGKGWPLCPQDIRPKAEQPLHSSRRGKRRLFTYLKVLRQTFRLARPKILDCPWAPSYSPPLPWLCVAEVSAIAALRIAQKQIWKHCVIAHYDNKAVELCIADLKKMLRCPPLFHC